MNVQILLSAGLSVHELAAATLEEKRRRDCANLPREPL
jgi:hypothetical protein